MVPIINANEIIAQNPSRTGHRLLDETKGCVAGCNCGISIYTRDTFATATNHEDQEGFYVLEGTGKALIGDEVVSIKPGDCFMVPAGTLHSMIRDAECEYCKVFWFHAAI